MNLNFFRTSLRNKLKQQKLTLSSLASLSDLSEDTLRSIIYGKSKDIKLSSLLKISDVLHCSIDELINHKAYTNETQRIFDRILKLPQSSINNILVITTLEEKRLLNKSIYGKHTIPLFIPKGNMRDGMYYDGNIYETMDITNYPDNLINDTSFGLKIMTDNYEPIYHKNDILLLSTNNKPKPSDIVLYINNSGKIFIRRLTNLGLEPIDDFGEIIPIKESRNYTPLGIVLKTVKLFDVEQYR